MVDGYLQIANSQSDYEDYLIRWSGMALVLGATQTVHYILRKIQIPSLLNQIMISPLRLEFK